MAEINLTEELEKIKGPVWAKIKEYLPMKEPEEHYAMVREYPERKGKYLRPALVMLSNEMFGGSDEKAILTAAAMQTSEDWILIHDDFEDHSEERRSSGDEYKPALHRIYGDELAVNAGDALHMIMWKMLGDNVRFLGDKLGWKIYDKMYDILTRTAEGQYMEMSWIRDGRIAITEEEYYKMIYTKAGYYTITGPLQLGAMLAGAPDDDIRKIEEWGVPLGCAFQIWDDTMNLIVDSTEQGKERGGDILEGKRTIMLIHLLSHCTIAEKNFIKTIYSKPRHLKTEQEKNYVLKLMEKYGSIEDGKKGAREFSEKAKNAFDKNTAHLGDTHAKKVIRSTIDFVVNRRR